MTEVKTKEQLLATLRDARAHWKALLDAVGEERMTTPGVAGDWSVKDLLGHLTAYHRVWGAQIRGVVTGVPPTPHDMFDVESLPENAGSWTLEEQNAAIHAQYDPLPAPVVLAKWREVSDLLAEGVAALTEEDITTPDRIPWARGQPLVDAMAGDTYQHAHIHAAQIRAWLDRI